MNLSKTTKIISKIFEVMFFLSSLVMIACTIFSFANPQLLGNFLLESVGNGTIATNGFEIQIAGKNGELLVGAMRFFCFAGVFSILAYTMIFRNIFLIVKNTEGKTWFSQGKTPFQKDNIRMIREIGIFSIFIPLFEIFLSIIAKIVLGVDNTEISVQINGIVMGIAVIFLSEIFSYGQKLEKDVEGLI